MADALALTFSQAIAPADLRAAGGWDRAVPDESPFDEL